MAWQVNWDGRYVVGGEKRTKLTPNFRLREFYDKNGKVKVHRELVSALQLLRNSFAASISIISISEDGFGATISASDLPGLLKAAEKIEAHRLFEDVSEDGSNLTIRIPDPGRLPEIEIEQALETAFSVTAGFETSGDRFQQVTGNFDGAGISFGPAQWNFGTGTLVPLFRLFEAADPETYKACFEDEEDYQEWQEILEDERADQISWANSKSTGRNNGRVVEPWNSYLRAVGRVEKFRAIMVEESLRKYGQKLLHTIEYLEGLAAGIKITHLRCICSIYDLVIQQGSVSRAKDEIESRIKRENPQDQFHLVRIAVEERGNKANPRFRSDCVSRRVGILDGVPTTIDGHQRANIHFYMLRDVHVQGTDKIEQANMREKLARVGRTIAAGDSLL